MCFVRVKKKMMLPDSRWRKRSHSTLKLPHETTIARQVFVVLLHLIFGSALLTTFEPTWSRSPPLPDSSFLYFLE